MEWKGTVWSVHVLVDLLVPVGSERRFRRIVRSAFVLSFLFSFRPTLLRYPSHLFLSFLSLVVWFVGFAWWLRLTFPSPGWDVSFPSLDVHLFLLLRLPRMFRPSHVVRSSIHGRGRTDNRPSSSVPHTVCVSLSLPHGVCVSQSHSDHVWGRERGEGSRGSKVREHRRIRSWATTSRRRVGVGLSIEASDRGQEGRDVQSAGFFGSFPKPRG